jgi:hypothetical protein
MAAAPNGAGPGQGPPGVDPPLPESITREVKEELGITLAGIEPAAVMSRMSTEPRVDFFFAAPANLPDDTLECDRRDRQRTGEPLVQRARMVRARSVSCCAPRHR